MIYDKLKNCARYAGLSPYFKKVFDYLANTDLAALPVGRYDIDGDNAYLLVQDKSLSPWERGVWEGHRKYADIQLVIEGEEILGVRPADDVEVSAPYDPQKDVLLFHPEAEGLALPLEEGAFAVLFPWDAHRPGILKPGGRTQSRRAVLKVRLD